MNSIGKFLFSAIVAVLAVPAAAVAQADPSAPGYGVPSGFVRVWEDDRLNPRRGLGTAQGEAQMNGIWTEDTPRQLRPVAIAPAVGGSANAVASGDVLQSVPGVFVQVGLFGDAGSAARAADQLARSGLPARRGVLRKGGSEHPLVLAGPYASVAAANTGLAEVHRLGYPDAFIRY